MVTVNLKCHCGEVQGVAHDVSPSSGNRVVCCCASCQEFANYLGTQADVLDEYGGTELFQLSQSQVQISQGHDKLQCVRLTPKGLLRWHSTCCNTAIGNTVKASLPFVGLIHTFLDIPDPDATLGKVRAYVQTQDATQTPGYRKHHAKYPVGITLRIIRKMLLWKIQRKNKPSPFFNEEGMSIVEPVIVSEKNRI